MINSITITGLQYEVDDTTKKYVTRKIGRLDRYLPRHARKTASVDIKLKQVNRTRDNKYEVDIVLTVPDRVITARDESMNMLAAVDIVEAKLVSQLRKYKMEKIPHIGHRGVLGRFKRSYARESQTIE